MSREFSFKQFTVKQENAAFKVGTDSVVLGAWANITSSKNILDIGTGTGLLALMCAQRNAKAIILAIEKDELSAVDASVNFQASVWSARLSVRQTPLEIFVSDSKFDYIICNPPYFLNALLPSDTRKADARHANKNWFNLLAQKINALTTEDATVGCVLPQNEFDVLNAHLSTLGWFSSRQQKLLPFPKGDKARILVEWQRHKQQMDFLPDLFVRNETRQFHADYINLTKDFYLKF